MISGQLLYILLHSVFENLIVMTVIQLFWYKRSLSGWNVYSSSIKFYYCCAPPYVLLNLKIAENSAFRQFGVWFSDAFESMFPAPARTYLKLKMFWDFLHFLRQTTLFERKWEFTQTQIESLENIRDENAIKKGRIGFSTHHCVQNETLHVLIVQWRQRVSSLPISSVLQESKETVTCPVLCNYGWLILRHWLLLHRSF